MDVNNLGTYTIPPYCLSYLRGVRWRHGGINGHEMELELGRGQGVDRIVSSQRMEEEGI